MSFAPRSANLTNLESPIMKMLLHFAILDLLLNASNDFRMLP
jgi:hypothetical protein